MNENIFKKSAKLLKDNIMLIQPLFIWMLVIMLMLIPLAGKKSFDIGFIFTLILILLCTTAFLAGWYNSTVFVVSLKNKKYETLEEHNKNQIEILKKFFPGVGEYILPVTVISIIYCGLGYGLMELYRLLAKKIFIVYNFPNDFFTVLNSGSQNDITNFLQNSLSHSQLTILLWAVAGSFVLYLIFNLIVLWFMPAIFYTSKNPLKAIWKSIIFMFKNIKVSLAIVIAMFLINMAITFIRAFTGNGILAFVPFLLTFVYLVYYVLTVFLYYEEKTQNNSNCGSECNG